MSEPIVSVPVSEIVPTTPESVENSSDVAENDAAITPPEAPKAEVKSDNRRKKFNFRVDGKDDEVEVDLDNEEELKQHFQRSRVAQRKIQETAELRKGVQELLDTLRTDPAKVLSDPRLQIPEETRKKLAEAIINDEISEMAKTPEQKETERLQREYERLKSQVAEEKQAKEAAERAHLESQQAASLDVEITGAVEALGLPKTARTVRYMADALYFCLQNNLDLSAKDLAPYIKKQTLSEFKDMISSLPDDEFENWLGKDQLSRLRKRNIQKAKVENPNNIKPTGTDVKKSDPDQKKLIYKDFFKSLGK